MVSEPIFLVGSERSGTTMLRLMLDSHPEIAFLEEFEYSVDQIIGERFPDLDDYYDYLATHRIFGTSGFEIDSQLDYPDLVNSFLAARQDAKNASFVGATIHYDFEKILTLWPDAKVIHIVRDPRDVANSVMNMGWAFNGYHAAEHWIEAEDSWDKLSAKLDPESQLELRYSKLISEYESELARICEFIGVEYSPAMLSYAYETDYDLPSPEVSSSWNNSLKNKDVQLVEAAIGARLSERGFEASGLEPIELNSQDLAKLKVASKSASLKFRISKYGLFNVVGNIVGSKLGVKVLADKTRLKMNEIEIKELKKSWRDDDSGSTSAR